LLTFWSSEAALVVAAQMSLVAVVVALAVIWFSLVRT
jgi:hypothetical protein